jgi:hypothetical protein
MPTVDEMMADLAAADAAGDTTLAQHIASRIKAAQAPPVPSESKAYGVAKTLGTMGKAGVTAAASLGGLANAPLALTGALASYMRPGDERSFGERFAGESAALRGEQGRLAKEAPTSTAVGSVLGPAAVAKALPGALNTLAPITSRTAEVLSPAGRAIAGGLDAMLFNAASAASSNLEKGAGALPQTAEALGSPAAFAVGSLAPTVMEKVQSVGQKASEALGRAADRIAYQELAKPEEGATRTAIEKFGSTEQAGRVFRKTLGAGGKPILRSSMDEAQRVEALKANSQRLADAKNSIVSAVDEAAPSGKSINFDEAQAELEGIYNSHFGSPADRVSGTATASAANKARRMMNDFFEKFRPVEGQGLPLAAWERFKSNLQKEVYDTAAKYPRSENARDNPTLRFLSDISGGVKGVGEKAVESALGPEKLQEFLAAKRGYGDTATLIDLANPKAIRAQTPESNRLASALEWGTHRLPYMAVGGLGGLPYGPTGIALGAAGGYAVGKAAPAISRASRFGRLQSYGALEDILAQMPDLTPMSREALLSAMAARLRSKE